MCDEEIKYVCCRNKTCVQPKKNMCGVEKKIEIWHQVFIIYYVI